MYYSINCSQKLNLENKKSQISLPSIIEFIPQTIVIEKMDNSQIVNMSAVDNFLVFHHKNHKITIYSVNINTFYEVNYYYNINNGREKYFDVNFFYKTNEEMLFIVSTFYNDIINVTEENLEIKCHYLDIQSFDYKSSIKNNIYNINTNSTIFNSNNKNDNNNLIRLNNIKNEDDHYFSRNNNIEIKENIYDSFTNNVGECKKIIYDVFPTHYFHLSSFLEYDNSNNMFITKDSNSNYKVWKINHNSKFYPVKLKSKDNISIQYNNYNSVSNYSINNANKTLSSNICNSDNFNIVKLCFNISDSEINDVRITKEILITIKIKNESLDFGIYDISTGIFIITYVLDYSLYANNLFNFEIIEFFNYFLLIKDNKNTKARIYNLVDDNQKIHELDEFEFNKDSLFYSIDEINHILVFNYNKIMFYDLEYKTVKRTYNNCLNEISVDNVKIINNKQLILLYWNNRQTNHNESYIYSDNILSNKTVVRSNINNVVNSNLKKSLSVVKYIENYRDNRLLSNISNDSSKILINSFNKSLLKTTNKKDSLNSDKIKIINQNNISEFSSYNKLYSQVITNNKLIKSSILEKNNYNNSTDKIDKRTINYRDKIKPVNYNNLLIGELEILDYSDLSFKTIKKISSLNSSIYDYSILSILDNSSNNKLFQDNENFDYYDKINFFSYMKNSNNICGITESNLIIQIGSNILN